jgi:general secretion pathway protein D
VSSKPGGFDIVRIFAFSRPARRVRPGRNGGRIVGRIVCLLALALSACVTPERTTPPAPAALPESLLPSQPLLSQQRPARALATLPQNEDEGTVPAPIVVRGSPSPPPAAGAAPAAGAGAADVTLNFSGADIRDVIAAVLGATLKLNYVVDPDVAGPVTFNVSRPLRRDEVLPVLEAVLESRGFALVQSDGIVRVMARPAAGKPQAAVQIASPGAVGERLEVFPVRYAAVADMAGMLAKLLPPGQTIVPDERRGLLMVRGTSDELRLAEDTIRIFDVDELSGTSVALLPLKNADAATVATELDNIFDATRKDAAAASVRVIPVERLNAVMVLTREPRSLDEARAWVARLDQARNTNEQRVYVYYLQYGKAGPVAETLQGALSGIDVEVTGAATASAQGLGAGTTAPSGGDAVPPPAPGFPTPPPLLVGPLAATLAPTPPPAQAASTRPSVKIEADDAHNALLISATPRDYALIRQVLEEIDIPPLQVLIEVTVAEVTLNDNLQYGVQYFLNSRGEGAGNVSTLLTTGATAAAIAPAVPGFSLAFTGAYLAPRVVLSALSGLTQTKVISTPRLMVLDNQTARLQVGDVVPIITQSAASTATSSPLVLSNVQYKETGVVLEVTPRVNASGYVTLDINQSVSDVVPTTSSTINSPTFSQRRLTSTISVKSGNSILLGGLIQNQDNRSSQGIPFLAELPVIGPLFGSRNDTTARTELIMFMTPYVLANDEDTADLTDRIKRQFQAVLDGSSLVQPRPTPR